VSHSRQPRTFSLSSFALILFLGLLGPSAARGAVTIVAAQPDAAGSKLTVLGTNFGSAP